MQLFRQESPECHRQPEMRDLMPAGRRDMANLETRLDSLIELAEGLGMSIRREPLNGSGGGMCVLKGKRVLFVDTLADLETRYERTLAAMAPLTELDAQYVRPDVREDIERQRANAD
jgi:hypothetical protein